MRTKQSATSNPATIQSCIRKDEINMVLCRLESGMVLRIVCSIDPEPVSI